MMRILIDLFRNDDAATLVEYALVVALIAVVAILAVTRFGTSTSNLINSAATSI
ncbi:MAG TPA: Flp family type IVb pilin [Candidatus Acidoferrales bacterium]|jgi:pilus assembly protein Flp/PilA|nr:Flp family type IVb pilin [Candidatus Acidoferrales bacterium]